MTLKNGSSDGLFNARLYQAFKSEGSARRRFQRPSRYIRSYYLGRVLITSLTRSGFGTIQAIRLAQNLFDPLTPDASLPIAVSKVMFQYYQLVRLP